MAPPSAAVHYLRSAAELLADASPAVARSLQLQVLKCGGGDSQLSERPCCPSCGTLFRTSVDVSSVEVIQAGRNCRRRCCLKGMTPSNKRPAPKQSKGANWVVVLQCQICSSKVRQPGKSEQAAQAASAQFVRRAVRPQPSGPCQAVSAVRHSRPEANHGLVLPLSHNDK